MQKEQNKRKKGNYGEEKKRKYKEEKKRKNS